MMAQTCIQVQSGGSFSDPPKTNE